MVKDSETFWLPVKETGQVTYTCEKTDNKKLSEINSVALSLQIFFPNVFSIASSINIIISTLSYIIVWFLL